MPFRHHHQHQRSIIIRVARCSDRGSKAPFVLGQRGATARRPEVSRGIGCRMPRYGQPRDSSSLVLIYVTEDFSDQLARKAGPWTPSAKRCLSSVLKLNAIRSFSGRLASQT